MPHYPVTGINTGLGPLPGQVPIRREVDEWFQNEPEQVSLFMLALAKFQSLPEDQKLAYYGITGIHGQPYVGWDEGSGDGNPPIMNNGYCAHSTVLFPTWHRPFIALYEQRIHEIMMEIAGSYSNADDNAKYMAAAQQWRLPYWEYTLPKTQNGQAGLRIPMMLEDQYQKINVYNPPGLLGSIDNPMWKYNFDMTSDIDPEYRITYRTSSGDYSICSETIRYPTRYNPANAASISQWRNGVQNNALITRRLQNETSLRDDFYKAMSVQNNYVAFATNADDPNYPQSLEDVHNTMHVIIGGGGHMAQVPVAAHDPIFWFHHCNIDRLAVTWQALNPDAWWSEDDRDGSTPQTPLTPFRMQLSDGSLDWWTSDACRDHTVLGYSYPALQRWLPRYNGNETFNEALYQSDIQADISNALGRTQKALWDGLSASTLRMAKAAPSSAAPSSAASSSAAPKSAAPSSVATSSVATSSVATSSVATSSAAPKMRGLNENKPEPAPRASHGLVSHIKASAHQLSEKIHVGKASSGGDASEGNHATSRGITTEGNGTMQAASSSGPSQASGTPHNTVSSSGSASRGLPSGNISGLPIGGTSGNPGGASGGQGNPGGNAGNLPLPTTTANLPKYIDFDDYVANVSFERFALGGEPFNIYFFLGDFNADANAAWDWQFETNLVGTVYNFVANIRGNDRHSCENCEQQSSTRLRVTGQVSLTRAILAAIEDHTIPTPDSLMDSSGMVDYLKKNLHWRIATVNGSDVPREHEDLSSLRIEVARAKARSPQEAGALTEYGPYETIYEITENRPCGATRPA